MLAGALAAERDHRKPAEGVTPISPAQDLLPMPLSQWTQQETREQGCPGEVICQNPLPGAKGRTENGSGVTKGAHWLLQFLIFSKKHQTLRTEVFTWRK